MPCLTLHLLVLLFAALTSAAGAGTPPAAAREALAAGRALVKVLSRNDTGATGSHQSGLYLPAAAWPLFGTTLPPDGTNALHPLSLTWPDGSRSDAALRWYGRGSRHEGRLTGLGSAGAAWLGPDAAGDLLVLVPGSAGSCRAHVLRSESESAACCAALGIEPGTRWALFPAPSSAVGDKAAWARLEASRHRSFPSGERMAALAREAAATLHPGLDRRSADVRLTAWMETEYALFRALEERLSGPELRRSFPDVDSFLAAAAAAMNRRKARAGRSLEAHVARLLTDAGIAFDAQPVIDGSIRPDILLPGRAAYQDPEVPPDRLVVLGLKTTCRDRWRQVLNEGRRVPVKHLLTLQPAMSRAQLAEMQTAGVRLVVPAPLHAGYDLPDGCHILTVEAFLREMRRRFPK